MKKRPFIVLYFAVIFLVFLAALLRSPSPSFNKYYLGSQADTRYELKDDSNIAFVFQISQNDLIGLYLNDYSSNGLTFKDEYIEVSVTDYVTMEQYQAASVWLSDQISEKNIFIFSARASFLDYLKRNPTEISHGSRDVFRSPGSSAFPCCRRPFRRII